MREYQLESYGNLLLTRAAVSGGNGIRVVKLLVDTGSSYTILPFEILEAIGCNPSSAKEKVRIGTANGYVIAPAVRVEWLHCLGHRIDDFRVVAHTLPFGVFTDGLLGVDYLTTIGAVIRMMDKIIEVF